MDPIVFRGIERLLIIVGAIFFGYLGYRLFVKGLTIGEGNLKFESKAMKIIFSGTGPGLFFMAFGAVVLVVAIAIGGVSIKEKTTSPDTLIVQPSATNREALEAANKRIAELTHKNAALVKSVKEVNQRIEAQPLASTSKPADPVVTSEREIVFKK
jgi:hypothetical protein